MSWLGKKPLSVAILGNDITKATKESINGHIVKSFDTHLKETLEARKYKGSTAVASTLERYQDADKWPQFSVALPSPIKIAVKRRAYDVDDDSAAFSAAGAVAATSLAAVILVLLCGPRTLLYGLACITLLLGVQALLLPKAVGYQLKRKWRSKIEDGTDLQVLVVYARNPYNLLHISAKINTECLPAYSIAILQC